MDRREEARLQLNNVIRTGFVAGTLAALVLMGLQPQLGWGIKILPSLMMAPRPIPEFPNQGPEAWVNSQPLKVADLRGKVVLIEVWTTS